MQTAVLLRETTAVLRAIVTAPLAWLAPAELAEALGTDLNETTDHLAALDDAGWITVWDRPDGPVVTLSPLGAERLKVRLEEFGAEPSLRWVPASQPEKAPPRAPQGVVNLTESWAERELRDERARWPTVLLGVSLTPWPGPAQVLDTSCPACHGAPLDRSRYCLLCDRWGGGSSQRTE